MNRSVLHHNNACRPSDTLCRAVDSRRGQIVSITILQRLAEITALNVGYKQLRHWLAENRCSHLGNSATELRNLILRVRTAVHTGKIRTALPSDFNKLPVTETDFEQDVLTDLATIAYRTDGGKALVEVLENYQKRGVILYRKKVNDQSMLTNATWMFADGVRRLKKHGDFNLVDGKAGIASNKIVVFMPTVINDEKMSVATAYSIGIGDNGENVKFCVQSMQQMCGLSEDKTWFKPKPTFMMDDKIGLEPIEGSVLNSRVQRCMWHKDKNIASRLSHLPKWAEMKPKIKRLLHVNSKEKLEERWNTFLTDYNLDPANKKAVKVMSELVVDRRVEFVSCEKNRWVNLGYDVSSPAESQNWSLMSQLITPHDGRLSLGALFISTLRHNRSTRAREQKLADANALGLRQQEVAGIVGNDCLKKAVANRYSNVAVQLFVKQYEQMVHYKKEEDEDCTYVTKKHGEGRAARKVVRHNEELDGYNPGYLCSCADDTRYRIACRHILYKLFADDELTVANIPSLIADRWRRTTSIPPEIKYSECVEQNRTTGMDEKNNTDEPPHDYGMDVDRSELTNENKRNTSPRSRYRVLQDLGRQLASIASKQEDVYEVVKVVILGMKKVITGEDASREEYKASLRCGAELPSLLPPLGRSHTNDGDEDGKNDGGNDSALNPRTGMDANNLSDATLGVHLPITLETAGRNGGRYKSFYETSNMRGKKWRCRACGAEGHTSRSKSCPAYLHRTMARMMVPIMHATIHAPGSTQTN